MAVKTLTYTWGEHSDGKKLSGGTDHYHSVAISDINSWLKERLPDKAVFDSATITTLIRKNQSLPNPRQGIYFANDASKALTEGYVVDDDIVVPEDEINGGEFKGYQVYYMTSFFNSDCQLDSTKFNNKSRLVLYIDNGWAFSFKISCPMIELDVHYYVPPTATFKDWDGTVLKTETVKYGDTPTAPSNPTRPEDVQNTYEFSDWKDDNGNSVGAITEDTTYTAQYTATPRKYYVGIIYDDETEGVVTGGFNGEYEYNTKLTLTATPKEGYYFDGWEFEHWHDTSVNPADNPITFTVLGDETVYARFKISKYLVYFINDDNTVLKEEELYYGDKPIPPPTPTCSIVSPVLEYSFYNWFRYIDGELQFDLPLTDETIITEYTVFKAEYSVIGKNFKVKITNGTADFDESFNGGAQIDKETFRYPARVIVTADEREGFEFSHWEGEMPEDVLGNIISNTKKQFSFHPHKDFILKAVYNPIKMIIKSSKIYYPTENELASSTNAIYSNDNAILEVKLELVVDKSLQES